MSQRIAILLLTIAAAITLPAISVLAHSDTNTFAAGYANLTPQQREGRDTWYTWTGGDTDAHHNVVGDQALWRILAVRSHGTVDLLQAIDSRMRNERFKRFGVINDPDCAPATGPDQYGLWLDTCAPASTPANTGQPAGIVGLRRFANPKFDHAKWDLKKYQADPARIEPPYLIGVACGFCHVGLNPLHPPADPEHPTWHNLHPGIGNQYFREQLFNTAKFPSTRQMQPNDFRWQVANAEPPGTSDTSQVATDHLFNASTINNIVYLNARPMHPVITADGVSRNVFNVLKDGADSVGAACLDDPAEHPGHNDTACAAMRGYLNIGVCAAAWTALVDPIDGIARKQSPLDIHHARAADPACDESWTSTVARLEGLEAFLRSFEPLHLADADNAQQYLPRDAAILVRGRQVFAAECARCHSSKRPPANSQESSSDWFRKSVDQPDFLTDNFLSDDERYPVSVIGTNAERALATNAERDHLWQQFSSDTYKQSPPVRVSGLPNPLLPFLHTHTQTVTSGAGYYRTPTLANVWATAPFLHNNSVGLYNADPSIAGRMAAYEDGMHKLLWPSQRLGRASIHRTTQSSRLALDGGNTLCIAAGTPVDQIANIQVKPRKPAPPNKLLNAVLCGLTRTGALNSLFLTMDNTTDFIQDRGHTFGAQLPDADKHALIEYMKTF